MGIHYFVHFKIHRYSGVNVQYASLVEGLLTLIGILQYTLIILRYKRMKEERNKKQAILIKSLEDMYNIT